MLDIKAIVADGKAFDKALKRRGLPPSSAELKALNDRRLQLIKRVEALRLERNQLAKTAVKQSGKVTPGREKQGQKLKKELAGLESSQKQVEDELRQELLVLPNVPLDDEVKDGLEPRIIKQGGHKPPLKDPKDHVFLGQALGMMDFGEAAAMSGARFVVLKGDLAHLERALAQFFLGHNLRRGYEEVSPPLLVKEEALLGSAQLPKFAEELFATKQRGFWLIPTAEVPLVNLGRNRKFKATELPKRYTSLTPCFRSEAGAAGKETRGIIRQHQFYKVELVSITEPEDSPKELERMTECAEALLEALGLCWRRVCLAAEDIGFAAAKTYDLEVWCAGQGQFREVSSCSNCRDFQSRRLGIKSEKVFAHTLNGSSLAVGRTMLAIMEHYQQENGEIIIPKVLREYMDGKERICAKKF